MSSSSYLLVGYKDLGLSIAKVGLIQLDKLSNWRNLLIIAALRSTPARLSSLIRCSFLNQQLFSKLFLFGLCLVGQQERLFELFLIDFDLLLNFLEEIRIDNPLPPGETHLFFQNINLSHLLIMFLENLLNIILLFLHLPYFHSLPSSPSPYTSNYYTPPPSSSSSQSHYSSIQSIHSGHSE